MLYISACLLLYLYICLLSLTLSPAGNAFASQKLIIVTQAEPVFTLWLQVLVWHISGHGSVSDIVS